jgi:hypothetical protein
MREKKFISSFGGGDSGRNKCKRGYDRVRQSQRLAGIWSQVVGFVFVRLAEISFARREDVSTLI